MYLVMLEDDDVDESFTPVWTCQGILRMPRVKPHENKDGTLSYSGATWLVPDYAKWSSIPGFPDLLWNPAKANAAFIRPMTPEERRDYYAVRKPSTSGPEGTPSLVFIVGSPVIRVCGVAVNLSGREHAFLSAAVQRKKVPNEEVTETMEAIAPESSMGTTGTVAVEGLHDYRKTLLARVEREAGRAARTLLGKAFHLQRGFTVYDASLLPARWE